VIEEGVVMVLATPRPKIRERTALPVSQTGGGVMPGVDLNRSSDLETVMNDS
jgi:hypothetical protein